MNTLTIARSFRQFAGRLRRMHVESRTERFLDSLPADIRKDIGWPDRFQESPVRRHPDIS